MSTRYSADFSFSSRKSDSVDSQKPALFARNGDTDTVLGDFIVRKMIGKGSFGKVYLIERFDTPSEVFAMKSIEKTRIIEEGLIQSASLESEILKETSHPFLINMEYVFQTDNKIMFVMPFAIGGELNELRRRRECFTEDEARIYSA